MVEQRRPAHVAFELLAPAELGVFLSAAPLLRFGPRGSGAPVLVLPGFGTGDLSTLPLRRVLRELGHRPVAWGRGPNFGPTPETIAGLRTHVVDLAERAGAPIAVVGWSLGGMYARALAQWHPDAIEQVITLGSPFNIEPGEVTNVSHLYDALERRGRFLSRDEIELDQIPVPSTAIFSRTDGIVAWESCLQTVGPEAENVEVRGSHCGLGVNLAVLWTIADRLANGRPWSPFTPPAALRALYPTGNTCVS